MFKPSDAKILVIGDIILDRYIHGKSSRLSPEAPVPVVLVDGKSEYRLGGAANVAANIKALGGNPILAGVLGFDRDSVEVTNLFANHEIDHDGVISVPHRKTSIKTRIIANNQQIVRMDCEATGPLPESSEIPLIRGLRSIAEQGLAAIVVSDYAKGALPQNVLYELNEISMNLKLPVFLDPKIKKGSVTRFYRPYVVTPNTQETEIWTGIEIKDSASLERAARMIRDEFHAENVLITRGDKGMTLCTESILMNFGTKAKDVYDVSGAGDTVIAALALATVSSYGLCPAIDIANYAAGVVVGKHGTSVCTIDELNLTLNRS